MTAIISNIDVRAPAAPQTVRVLTTPAQWQLVDVQKSWEAKSARGDSIHRLFQSPTWIDHLSRHYPNKPDVSVAIVDSDCDSVGVVPFIHELYPLDIRIKSHTILPIKPCVATILGNIPLLPDEKHVHDATFLAIMDQCPVLDGIHLRMLPKESFCWRHLSNSPVIHGRFILYTPDGAGINHSINLASTFQDYLSKFKSKKRANLKRQVRNLQDHGAGRLKLHRIERAADIPTFLVAADQVSRASWQFAYEDGSVQNNDYWQDELSDLASRGLLRSYWLECGEQPCAYAFGYQHEGVYHYDHPSFSESFAPYSPGAVLLYLLIEDLIEHRPAERLSFGFGDSHYKQVFGNCRSEDMQVLLLRKTFMNRFRRDLHRAYRGTVKTARKWLKGNGH